MKYIEQVKLERRKKRKGLWKKVLFYGYFILGPTILINIVDPIVGITFYLITLLGYTIYKYFQTRNTLFYMDVFELLRNDITLCIQDAIQNRRTNDLIDSLQALRRKSSEVPYTKKEYLLLVEKFEQLKGRNAA